jgi:hypothetical protein
MRCATVAIAILFQLTACSYGDTGLPERLSYWRAEVRRGIPIGANREAVAKWASDRGLHSIYFAEQSTLWTELEAVPVRGLKYPCTAWVIYLSTHINSVGHVDHKELSTSKRCE